MLYSFLRSKKGYSFVEVLIVVIVLGILVAVGVPVFTSGYNTQAKKDCNNQRVVISSLVKEAMSGMIDNGRMQEKINFAKLQSDHKTTYSGDGVTGNGDDDFVGKECFVLIEDQGIPGKIAFTIGDLRGGYFGQNEWNSTGMPTKHGSYDPYNDEKYDLGCYEGYYLKKERLKDNKFFWYLTNEEIPVCPFADSKNDYHYYIFEDGTVLCDCPECNDIED